MAAARDVPPELEEKLPEHLRLVNIRQIEGAPGPGRRGASSQYLKAVRERKLALHALDPEGGWGGGRRRTKFTKAEAEENALAAMLPRALRVLQEQLDSPDMRVRQTAAIKVLEYNKGKPVQAIQQETQQITRIVYESAAWDPSMEIEGEAVEVEPLELPAEIAS